MTSRIITIALLAFASTATAYAFDRFPLNGDFEAPGDVAPAGWQAEGVWRLMPLRPWEGEQSLHVFPALARPGMTLRSGGYRLVRPGERLALTLAWQADAPGASVGLELCDALGRPIGDPVMWELAPNDSWERFERRYLVGSAGEPAGVRSVRVFVAIDARDVTLRVDDVRLEGDAGERSALPTPEIDPLDDADLLPEAEPRTVTPQTAFCDEPLLLDGWLPYRVSGTIEPGGPHPCALNLFARLLGADDRVVLFQQPLAAIELTGQQRIEATIPAILQRPGAVRLQLVAEATGAPVVLRDLSVRPAPVELSLNGVAKRTTFEGTDAVQIFVGARNYTASIISAQVVSVVRNEEHTIVARDRRPVAIGPRSFASFAVHPELPGVGRYTMQSRLLLSNRQIGAGSFEFEVVEPPQTLDGWRTRPFTVKVSAPARCVRFEKPGDVQLFVSAINNADRELFTTASMRVIDVDDEVAAEEDRAIRIAPRSAAYFPYSPRLADDGDYRFEVGFTDGDDYLGEGAYQFAVGGDSGLE